MIREHFQGLTDPRIGQVQQHNLLDIITLTLGAVICGAAIWSVAPPPALTLLRQETTRRGAARPRGKGMAGTAIACRKPWPVKRPLPGPTLPGNSLPPLAPTPPLPVC